MTEHDERLLGQALEYHRAGQFAEARRLYEDILRSVPDQIDVLYLLAVTACQTGQWIQSADLLRRSIALAPDQDRCYDLLGQSLAAMGLLDEAESNFRQAITLAPLPDYYNNLGVLWKGRGRLDDAIGAFQEARTRAPEFSAAHYNLGLVYRNKGLMEQAAEAFHRTLELEPESGNAAAALGQILLGLERAAEAVPLLRKAVSQLPDDAGLLCDLGNGLQTLGQLPEACDAYRRSLELDPKLGRAWYAAGCAESSRKQFVPAVDCFRRALEFQPDWAAAQHNLGKVLYKLGQVEEAMDCFRRAAAAGNPALPEMAIAVIIPGDPAAGNQAILDARRKFAERHLPITEGAKKSPRPIRLAPRPLRVGYISSFFQDHNWMKPVWGLINHHDREHFEIHLFSDAPASKIRQGYTARPEDRFYDISRLSNQALGQLIETAEVDVLVDLNGYSAVERLPLFTLRPAPVVAAWFNMYATSGIAGYDYLIGDDTVVSPGEEKFYSETILRVAGSYLTFEVSYPVPPVSDAPCQRNGAITFGCLASQYKITNAVVTAWSEILKQVPDSTLIVKNGALGSPDTQRFLQSLFEQNGVAPERVQMLGPSDHFQFLEAYGKIDLALDTFPYNGGTTTTEAIWQGVPVVTFTGDRWVARTSASILHAGGLDELIAPGAPEYVSKAVQLANSPEHLVELRRTMRERLQNSPVCDTHAFARRMEQLYTSISRK